MKISKQISSTLESRLYDTPSAKLAPNPHQCDESVIKIALIYASAIFAMWQHPAMSTRQSRLGYRVPHSLLILICNWRIYLLENKQKIERKLQSSCIESCVCSYVPSCCCGSSVWGGSAAVDSSAVSEIYTSNITCCYRSATICVSIRCYTTSPLNLL